MMSRFYVYIFVILLTPIWIVAHCQIPCGIYDDEARFNQLYEHIETIEKSMNLIDRKDISRNQIARWVINKEHHADAFRDIVVSYFLTQRIKPLKEGGAAADQERYHAQLQLGHQLIVLSMKAKQTTDVHGAQHLKKTLDAFKALYL